jgi:hypothetical protein
MSKMPSDAPIKLIETLCIALSQTRASAAAVQQPMN